MMLNFGMLENLWKFYNILMGKIIVKAKISCENSGISVLDHFTDVNKMVQIGSGAYREQTDYKLTRFILYSFIILKHCLNYIVIYNNILI